MSGVAERTDIGAFINPAVAVLDAQVVAGAGGDGVYVDGAGNLSIDRNDHNLPLSLGLAVVSDLALAAEQTATIQGKIQDSADGITFEDYAEAEAVVYITAGAGTRQVYVKSVNLVGARRYIKALLKVTMSAAGTDTADTSALVMFEKGDRF